MVLFAVCIVYLLPILLFVVSGDLNFNFSRNIIIVTVIYNGRRISTNCLPAQRATEPDLIFIFKLRP